MAKREHIEFACMLAIEAREMGAVCDNGSTRPRTPQLIARDVMALIKLARAVNRCALYLCNVGDETPRMAKAYERARQKAASIVSVYCASVETGGDPRGYTMRLHLKSGRSNTFGSDGWGVPT